MNILRSYRARSHYRKSNRNYRSIQKRATHENQTKRSRCQKYHVISQSSLRNQKSLRVSAQNTTPRKKVARIKQQERAQKKPHIP